MDETSLRLGLWLGALGVVLLGTRTVDQNFKRGTQRKGMAIRQMSATFHNCGAPVQGAPRQVWSGVADAFDHFAGVAAEVRRFVPHSVILNCLSVASEEVSFEPTLTDAAVCANGGFATRSILNSLVA